ncbi:MAG: hypothetical protein IJ309_01560 [Clostridia bacterium]|nr:hypothetical protein [Clostridia bacterium]
MKRLVAILLLALMLFALVSCDYSDTIEEYSKNLNSTLHGLLDPYLKEDEKYHTTTQTQQDQGASGLAVDPEL